MSAPAGNQFAKKAKLWENALKRALARKAAGNLEHGLDALADKVVSQAIDDGSKDAWQEIANRLDGKPAQSVTVGGDEENPLRTINEVLLRAVDAARD